MICIKDALTPGCHTRGMSEGILHGAMDELGSRPSPPPISGANAPARAAVSLAPREHGAYGQLVLPLVVALSTGGPSWVGWLFTVAAVAAFASHEPLLVVLGRRGRRARSRGGSRALRLLFATVGIGSLAAALALAFGSSSARWGALWCAVLVVPVAAQIARDAERSLVGELLTASMLPALALPVALSGGVPGGTAVGVWLVWSLSFAAATCAERDTVAHFKRGRALYLRLAPLAAVAIVVVSALALGLLGRMQIVAATPLLATLLAIALRPPHPRQLRRVGWILLVASAITAALLIV